MDKIKVYGTRWSPECHRVRQVLSGHNIIYDWVDIDRDEEACAYVEKVNGGYKSVPTIIFPDGSMLIEPDNEILQKKLDDFNNDPAP